MALLFNLQVNKFALSSRQCQAEPWNENWT